jgi:hypothetical protein
MCKSDIGSYLERIEATYRARFHKHTNTSDSSVTYACSEYSHEVNESNNPTAITGKGAAGIHCQRYRWVRASDIDGTVGGHEDRAEEGGIVRDMARTAIFHLRILRDRL